MVAFRIWGKFASFRDPFTISQNISFSIPPKTVVAGMVASILGKEDYLEEEDFFNFYYSVIIFSPIRKKSFSQNYINDYTGKVLTQLNNLKKQKFDKIQGGLRDKKNPQKPINRELILNPNFLIILNNFKYEKELINNLKEKKSIFSFYLGNSEFLGNFEFIEIKDYYEKSIENEYIDSFVLQKEAKEIKFCEGVRYSKLSFALSLDKNRSPLKFGNVVLANQPILLRNSKAFVIKTSKKEYKVQFI